MLPVKELVFSGEADRKRQHVDESDYPFAGFYSGGAIKSAVIALVFTMVSGSALAHGGGCRKDSPPGQCCHRDHKSGTFHCH